MKIRLDLSGHCIETEVNRRHEAAMSRYFKGREDVDALDAELVLLEAAIDAFDFEGLRSGWPVMAGGEERPVFLTRDDRDRPCLQFDGRRIVPPANEG
ncbi:MAG TPA: hypothetical protein VLT88_12885 [Desulfosarcina sp.]|nr:hypothetical protein [Desulfosarcina sp.]